MRVFLLCASLLYSGAAFDDTEFIKPSQPPTLQEVLDNSLPDWIGQSERRAYGD